MNYEHIKGMILEVYGICNIQSFPIDCFKILEQYHLRTYTYTELKEYNLELYKICMLYSNDAFCYKDTICYNEDILEGRIRFSLMHELGHIVLGHPYNHTDTVEQEANYFVSNILAPRLAIYYANCRNNVEVSKLFSITLEASEYAFNDYRRFKRRLHINKLSPVDKKIYQHFYHPEFNAFVFHLDTCSLCGAQIHNHTGDICFRCLRYQLAYQHSPDKQESSVNQMHDYLQYRDL